MYRQTNEAIKRGDVFQQRPCPFYQEMHRIFSGNDDTDQSALNSQSLDNDEEENDETEEEHPINSSDCEDKFARAIDRLVQYQQQSEVSDEG